MDLKIGLNQRLNITKNFSSFLYSESKYSLRKVNSINPVYENNNLLDGRIVIRDNFDKLLEKYDNLIIFGQDVGLIGDVNQGLEGLQKKYGEHRVSDTGVLERQAQLDKVLASH